MLIDDGGVCWVRWCVVVMVEVDLVLDLWVVGLGLGCGGCFLGDWWWVVRWVNGVRFYLEAGCLVCVLVGTDGTRLFVPGIVSSWGGVLVLVGVCCVVCLL